VTFDPSLRRGGVVQLPSREGRGGARRRGKTLRAKTVGGEDGGRERGVGGVGPAAKQGSTEGKKRKRLTIKTRDPNKKLRIQIKDKIVLGAGGEKRGYYILKC